MGRFAVGVTVVATATALHFGRVADAGTQLALDMVALATFAAVFLIERRAPFLTLRIVWGSAALLLVVAVALPPQGSKDVWSYAAYGRMVAQHDVSPYVHR